MENEKPQENRFLDFLARKNIDARSLKENEPALFEKWEHAFAPLHEESFLMQQKFLINPVRRKYPLVKHITQK
jgi:hypothetical protein